MSKIYLVERDDGLIGYDEYRAFVVVANSPAHARSMCSKEAADEGKDVWLRAITTLLSKVPIEAKPRIILGDFNAG